MTAIPIGLYIKNFHGFLVSTYSADWGTFGDFIGGILNPLFAACNLLLLIYISYEIADNEEKRNQNNIKIEEERNKANAEIEEARNKHNNEFQKKLLLSELRQNAVKEFTACKEKFYNTLGESQFKSKKGGVRLTSLFHSEIIGLIDQYEFLFQGIDSEKWKEETNITCNDLKKILKELTEPNEQQSDRPISETDRNKIVAGALKVSGALTTYLSK